MQHLGLLSILLLTAGLSFTVFKWPGGIHMSFSQHVAVSRESKIFYSLIFIVVLPILMAFFAFWLVPHDNLPDAFLWFAWIAVLFQIVCTWVPEEGGKKTIIHRLLTGISGISLLPLVVIVAVSTTSALISYSALTALSLMLALLVIALSNQKGLRYALLFQIGYYALFFGVILLVTYIN